MQSYYGLSSKPSKEYLLRREQILLRVVSGDCDYYAVCDLLFDLSEAIRQGVPLTPGHAVFLADALRNIAEGGDPKAAFHIRRKRGERDTRGAVFRNTTLAFKIARLRREKKGSTRGRMSIDEAIGQVALEDGILEDTVRAAWRDYRRNVELMDSGSAFVDYTPKKRKKRLKAQRKKQPKK